MSIRVHEKLLKSGEYKVQLMGAGPMMCLTTDEAKQLILDLREQLEIIEDKTVPQCWRLGSTPIGRLTFPYVDKTE